MIQAIKDAALAGFESLAGVGGVCHGVATFSDSEIAAQPSANSPILQMQFVSEAQPVAIQGIGSPTHFESAFAFRLSLKSTAPAPQSWRDLFALWLRREGGSLTGVQVGVNQLLATGLETTGGDRWAVSAGELKPVPPRDGYTAQLELPLLFSTMFSS